MRSAAVIILAITLTGCLPGLSLGALFGAPQSPPLADNPAPQLSLEPPAPPPAEVPAPLLVEAPPPASASRPEVTLPPLEPPTPEPSPGPEPALPPPEPAATSPPENPAPPPAEELPPPLPENPAPPPAAEAGPAATADAVPSGTGEFATPVQGEVLVGFGFVTVPNVGLVLSTGIDMAAPLGTPIAAARAGVVTSVGFDDSGLGLLTIIDHGEGILTLYGYQQAATVQVGQRVFQGDIIGFVGQGGPTSAPALHFEIKINGQSVDPVPLLSGAPPPPPVVSFTTSSPPAPSAPPPDSAQCSYFVQVGAFASPANAQNLIDLLRSQGYNVQERSTASGLHRVLAGPYCSRSAAEEATGRLQGAYPGAFVVEQAA